MADVVAKARRMGGTAAAKVRSLEGKRLKLDSSKALLKFVGGVVQDVLAGSVDPSVANATFYGCSIQERLLKTSDLEARLAALESHADAGKVRQWPA